MSSTSYVLVEAGASTPAAVDPTWLDALDHVTVRQEHDGASTFQIVFNADETAALEDELPIIGAGTFSAGNRIRVGVQIDSTECWLIDGVSTFEELLYDRAAGSFTFVVTGEDLSVFMRLQEKSAEWPGRSSTQIVREILANYSSYGLESSLTTPSNDVTPEATLWIREQNTDDLSYIRQLGRTFGYIFALQCGASTSDSTTAYWGPPPRVASSLPPLHLGAGDASDVESITFSFDGASAELFSGGSRQDTSDDTALAVTSSTDWSLSKLAKAASTSGSLARTRQFIAPETVGALATSSVDGFSQISARGAAKADVVIDGFAYRNVIVPANLLEIRGAGSSRDGNYYVETVEHQLRRGEYKQHVTLSREGLGTTL